MSEVARRGGRPVVGVGGHVDFRGVRWQVVALCGQRVHLAAEGEQDLVVLSGYLFADPSFALAGPGQDGVVDAVPQWGLFETAPAAARERALAWLRHIREVETGHPDGAEAGHVLKECYDPERYTLAERERAKAEELTAVGFGKVSRATVQKMRLDYRRQGLWGLVDHRTTRVSVPAGRTDERVVEAVKEAIRRRRGRSKGTVKALFPVAARILADRHGGEVAMCSQATFYRLVAALTDPREDIHGRGDGVPGPRQGRAFTPTVALRPGEQVQVDTTRLDVLAVFDDGTLGRPELTIAVDVATRAILAAVLRPHGTKAVDAALLLAEMAVPHPARPAWPNVLRFDHSPALNREALVAVDERLAQAAARPVVVPETIVVDRGKVYLSTTFTAACRTLGISVQPAPPHAPTAKGIVERTFGSINTLLWQYVPGYTGPNVAQRGRDVEEHACYSVAQLQDVLDEWLVHWHHRPHQGLRHPALPKVRLTPMQMWDALVAVAGHVPLPFTGRDYLELLPVRWLAIHDHGIRLEQRTYDADLLGPWRGQPSAVTARGGRWEVHYNPHDLRQIWIRLPGHPDGLVEIPWIHRDHVHQPFDDRTWHHLRTTLTHRSESPDHREADLAHALDDLQRRATSGGATRTEQAVLTRAMPARIPHPAPATRTGRTNTRPPATATTADTDTGTDKRNAPVPSPDKAGGPPLSGNASEAAGAQPPSPPSMWAQPPGASGTRTTVSHTGEDRAASAGGAQAAVSPRAWARPSETGSHPSSAGPSTAKDADAVAADGPDGDGLVDGEDPDGLLDPDDTDHGSDPTAAWPDDNDDGDSDSTFDDSNDRRGDPRLNTPGHDGEDPEDDTDDDGWDDDLGPARHSPAPPYTGLGLWNAHKEAELW
ncbi:Mu transposase C-terminal domain-containing protein [Kitasatospora paracochleata]|uniref:Mu transposase C-terminal domain-containing protein n=1 Tax=Kitasatospora paracochleata TaxID=58354 RepID=UPI0031D22293